MIISTLMAWEAALNPPWTIDNPLQAVLLGAVLGLGLVVIVVFVAEKW